ncbi:MAG TPA: AMMECR1 domain-containing protein [Firmicutes bacterium]|jgi:MEMO1 family protein|nr:AMMECR1 domain-containing protein [Bacillota bacterium]
MITLGALTPHPPIIVSGIGKGPDLAEAAETIKGMQEINRLLAADPPETLIVFTPHGTVFSDAVVVYGDETLSGDLSGFGLQRIWEWKNDRELAAEIVVQAQALGLPVLELDQNLAKKYRPQGALDHGVLVPLSFFTPEWAEKVRLVVIPLSYLPLEELYRFGTTVQAAINKLGRKTAIIASGDLSHCLKPGAPAGYDARGAEFDQKLIDLLKDVKVKKLFQIDPVLLEKAAECGFRSIIMLMGALDGTEFQVTIHSYQGPFGVGYGVASFKLTGVNRKSLLEDIFEERHKGLEERRKEESPPVSYARKTVEAYVKGEAMAEPVGLESFMNEKAGTFVSIKKHGQLRGCIGTTEPTQKNVVEEIKQNAVSASTRDPRFDPISAEELPDLVYSVDILKPAEPVAELADLDPERYGVIVSQGYRRGLLLPNLEGIETAEEQVAIAMRKAGIPEQAEVELERFEVVRYT